MDTWRRLIQKAASKHGETVDAMTISIQDGGLDIEFENGFGKDEGCPFTAWSATRVYFAQEYDGYQYVVSAPRNPCEIRMDPFEPD